MTTTSNEGWSFGNELDKRAVILGSVPAVKAASRPIIYQAVSGKYTLKDTSLVNRFWNAKKPGKIFKKKDGDGGDLPSWPCVSGYGNYDAFSASCCDAKFRLGNSQNCAILNCHKLSLSYPLLGNQAYYTGPASVSLVNTKCKNLSRLKKRQLDYDYGNAFDQFIGVPEEIHVIPMDSGFPYVELDSSSMNLLQQQQQSPTLSPISSSPPSGSTGSSSNQQQQQPKIKSSSLKARTIGKALTIFLLLIASQSRHF